ncbi:MAG: TetR/AcrR family transcriptional regulator [Melioribacteraceae bacterium]|nr:TetR/AcrR family transcriptional regulator [Melioribacteraceae bacterium]MCO6474357.1 TetR/AcrR family transcriptional regulator [Melioribacteraceae bacterium]MDD3559126.1 TetR/AcrR family transcriptional regulator [Melioribacteraceae bacterium]
MSTKEKILTTALKMISENGYSGTSIRKIAFEVGVRESAIYNHFDSKEEILQSILAKHSKSINASEIITEELIDLLGTPKIFLERLADKIIEQWTSDNEQMLWKILLKEEISVSLDPNYNLGTYLKNLLGLFELLFQKMSEHGFIKKIPPKILAIQFISPFIISRMTVSNSDNKKEILDAKNNIKQHVDIFWESIKR